MPAAPPLSSPALPERVVTLAASAKDKEQGKGRQRKLSNKDFSTVQILEIIIKKFLEVSEQTSQGLGIEDTT